MDFLFDRHAPIRQLAPAVVRQKPHCGAKWKPTALVADTRPTPGDRRDHISTVTHPDMRSMTTGNWLVAMLLPAFPEADGPHQQQRVALRQPGQEHRSR